MLSEPSSMTTLCYALDLYFKGVFPSSSSEIKSRCNEKITVWDVGPGWGKWALLIREIVASQLAEAGDMTPSLDKLTLCGFEMCHYFSDHLREKSLYDQLYIGDFRKQSWASTPAPDLILMFDVLEHWGGADICDSFHRIFTRYPDTAILVSVPVHVHMYEEPYYGEDCLKHQNEFGFAFYESLGYTITRCERNALNCVFWVTK